MRFVIFSGTTEGRALSLDLARLGAAVTVCVATEYGSEQQGDIPGVETRTGRLTAEEMVRVIRGAALCLDATHPYATAVTEALRTACQQAAVPYRRLLRAESQTQAGALAVDDAAAAAAYLSETEGNILLTIAAQALPAFAGLAPERLFPRILPTHEGLTACEALGVPHRNIIAMQGPFSEELNLALLRQFAIRYLVTKDGGGPGGFPEKCRAAAQAGATLILLRRPEEEGLPYAAILAECRDRLARGESPAEQG